MKHTHLIPLLGIFSMHIFAQNTPTTALPTAKTDSAFVGISSTGSAIYLPIGIDGKIPTYKPTPNKKRLKTSAGCILGASVIGYGILYAMPSSVTNWNKSEMGFSQLGKDWWSHVKAGPVWDHDKFWLNYLAHPYCGALYFMTARSAGYNFGQSMGFSFIMSTFFWEYGIEAFAEVPSIQDIIVTPVLGACLGEGFYYAKRSIIKNDRRIWKQRWLGQIALSLMDPLNEIQDAIERHKQAHKKSHLEMSSNLGLVPSYGGIGYGLSGSIRF